MAETTREHKAVAFAIVESTRGYSVPNCSLSAIEQRQIDRISQALADAEQAGYERGKREASKFADGEEVRFLLSVDPDRKWTVLRSEPEFSCLIRYEAPGIEKRMWVAEDQLEKIS